MKAGIEREFASRADQRVLRWFWHVERMDEYRLAKRVLMTEVSGGRVRGRPRLAWMEGWMDGVEVALGNRGMTVEAASLCAKDRKEWRTLVHMKLNEFQRPFLLGPVFFRTALRCTCGYHLKRGGMPVHDTVGINCKKGATTENQRAVASIGDPEWPHR